MPAYEPFGSVESSVAWLGICLHFCTFWVFHLPLLKSGSLLAMYGTLEECTFGVVLGALSLGFLEDFVCSTYFACALWIFDASKLLMKNSKTLQAMWRCSALVRCSCLTPQLTDSIATFIVSWLLYIVMMAPFVADLLIVNIRGMRFTFDLISMAIEEKDHVRAAPISSKEINEGYVSAATLLIVAKIFALVRTKTSWGDLTRWNPTLHLANYVLARMSKTRHQAKVKSSKGGDKQASKNAVKDSAYVDIELSDDNPEIGAVEYADDNEDREALLSSSKPDSIDPKLTVKRLGVQTAIAFTALVFLPVIIVAISCASSPLVAYSAMNGSLNVLFSHALEPTVRASLENSWMETFIHNATENHALYGSDTLYRRTTGFQGDLAFDVEIATDNPPNVLLISIESFQYHDSRYLVGDKDPSNLFKGTNVSITPNFDKWAKRGVALRNFWSSVRTSRSIESLLFAQIPYDIPVHTGMAGGKRDTNLAGLPQLFTAKGYETFFTTGCTTHYDSCDIFLPIHGFDTVWSEIEMKKLAESNLGIKNDDWKGPEARGMHWGVHGDVSFQLLGDLLINKTREQRQRVLQGKPKKPVFLTHYTISSHGPYEERPKWYAEAEKPDFSALYEGSSDPRLKRDYLEMRYFSDLELGKFLNRMADTSILNDTIVVITGDHGTGDGVSSVRVAGAIIAEGRLGNKAGLVIDDAAEHYDILNTLADITGVPPGGYVQEGVGCSLKRNVTFGERRVFSNDPNKKMSIVRGHQRLVYDRISDAVFLHNADTDHHSTVDLFPELSPQEQAEWLTWRDNERFVSNYYTDRWDKKCLFAVKC